MQTGKDPQDFEMTLDSHPFKIAPKNAKVLRHGNARMTRLFPIADRPVKHPLIIPGDISISEQAHQVVGQWSVNSILKVQHPRFKSMSLVVKHHQISAVPVAVNGDLRLAQRHIHQTLKTSVELGKLFRIERNAFVLGNVPV